MSGDGWVVGHVVREFRMSGSSGPDGKGARTMTSTANGVTQ